MTKDNPIERYLHNLLFVFKEYAIIAEDEKEIAKDKARWMAGKLFRKKLRIEDFYGSAFVKYFLVVFIFWVA